MLRETITCFVGGYLAKHWQDLDSLREVWVFAQDCSRLKLTFGIAKSSDLR